MITFLTRIAMMATLVAVAACEPAKDETNAPPEQATSADTSEDSSAADRQISFSEDIFPVLKVRCLSCHVPGGSGFEASGLDMRTYESLMQGTKYGPMIIPGNADESNLLTLIDGKAAIRMPHNAKRMSKCERAEFRQWVEQGARNN